MSGTQALPVHRFAIWFGHDLQMQCVAASREDARAWGDRALDKMHGHSSGMEINGISVLYQCYERDYHPDGCLPLDAVELIEPCVEEEVTP